jgi:hypothetical protein
LCPLFGGPQVKNGSGPPNVEHSLISAPHGMQPPPRLTPSPDDGLNSCNSPQLSAEVGVTLIEAYAYGRGYVATDVQLLVNLLGGEDHYSYRKP